MNGASHEVNSALTELMGEKIGLIVKKFAEIHAHVDLMNAAMGEGAGDGLQLDIFDLVSGLSEILKCYILDAIDAQILKNNFDALQEQLSSEKVINRPSKKFQRKGK